MFSGTMRYWKEETSRHAVDSLMDGSGAGRGSLLRCVVDGYGGRKTAISTLFNA